MIGAVSSPRKMACITRFGSHFLAVRGAADGLRAFMLTLRETKRGPALASEIRGLREEGG